MMSCPYGCGVIAGAHAAAARPGGLFLFWVHRAAGARYLPDLVPSLPGSRSHHRRAPGRADGFAVCAQRTAGRSDPRVVVCAFPARSTPVRRCRSSTGPEHGVTGAVGRGPPSRMRCIVRTCSPACRCTRPAILIAAPALGHDGVAVLGAVVSRIRLHRHRGCRTRGTQHPGSGGLRAPPSCCCSRSCRPYRLWHPGASALVGAPDALLAHTAPAHYQRAVTVALFAGVALLAASHRLGSRREAG